MIKNFKKECLDEITNIWLKTNIETHNYIPSKYWINKTNQVKELLLLADIYIYEENNNIKGFIGLNNNNIEGLFIKKEFQSQNIGTKLLNFIKTKHNSLTLKVYTKNKIAIKFYKKNNFKIIKKELDQDTQEEEYLMEYSS
ncbi:GNAT family N-acetyltransferase [Methanobrevibacter sp. DSM 116169]|uniref:GNAT family N-acetyltransferase n=1 Tax=Methanobrevibacter sp. DSM 116169 TaxID=3242727 RepID=UPI0038FCC407